VPEDVENFDDPLAGMVEPVEEASGD